MNQPKNITIGITGSIAAYKIPELIRQFQGDNVNIRVIATKNALQFVTKTTLQTVCGHKVYDDQWNDPLLHIEIARSTDVFVIAPITANSLAKLAHGQADDLLATTLLATTKPILLCPAMNTVMWEHTLTQQNIDSLQNIENYQVLAPRKDTLACGECGSGKMASLESIVAHTQKLLTKQDLQHKKVVITGGPTQEYIDSVRYISNGSSGKMGIALAKAAWLRGADVTLITGPISEKIPEYIDATHVINTSDMAEAVQIHISDADLFISAAAVCDIKPQQASLTKLKKNDLSESLAIEKTKDILKLSTMWKTSAMRIGFALEDTNIVENAQKKRVDKQLDFIVANDPHNIGAHEGNFMIIGKKSQKNYEHISKIDLAHIIFDTFIENV